MSSDKINIEELQRRIEALERENHSLKEEMLSAGDLKKQLSDKDEKYKMLFENAPLGYQSLDINGNFIEVNSAWCKVLGYEKEEVLGRNFSEFLHEDFKDVFRENFPKFKTLGAILGIEFEMKKKDGSFILVSFNGNIGKKPDGSFQQTHCILNDITQKKIDEEKLRTSEREKSLILSSISESVAYHDKNLNLVWANKATERFANHTLEEITGKICYESYHGKKQPCELCPVLESIENKTTVHRQMKDTNDLYWDITVQPIVENGEFVGAVKVAREFTEQKLAELALKESKERLTLALEAADEGIWDWNNKTRNLYLSPRFYTMLGYIPYDFEQSVEEWEKLIHPNFQQAFQEHILSAAHGEVFNFEIVMEHKTDGWIWLICRGKLIEKDDLGQPIRTIGTLININRRKKVELELIKLNETLEERINKRTHQIEEAYEEIRYEIEERKRIEQQLIEANIAKDKFFSIIAHALKNPIQALILSSDLLIRNWNKYDLSKIDNKLAQIFHSTRQVSDLLEKLLDWARAQSGRIRYIPEELNLRDMVEDCIHKMGELAANKTVQLVANISHEQIVYADRNMLLTILRNLITNGIQYSHDHSRVVVSASESSRYTVIEIEDKGVGINEKIIDKLFKIDEHISTPGTHKEIGSGLGLILCKEFLNNHNGTIEVRSVLGEGSVFTVKLPRKSN